MFSFMSVSFRHNNKKKPLLCKYYNTFNAACKEFSDISSVQNLTTEQLMNQNQLTISWVVAYRILYVALDWASEDLPTPVHPIRSIQQVTKETFSDTVFHCRCGRLQLELGNILIIKIDSFLFFRLIWKKNCITKLSFPSY